MTTKVSEFDVEIAQKDAYLFEIDLGKPHYAKLLADEPPPLGKDAAPAPSRLLAAAIGNCLSASLVFCMKRHQKVDVTELTTRVHVEVVRNEQRRLRIGKMTVTLQPKMDASPEARESCQGLFEDFCTVTQSVREGIDIEVNVEPKS